MIPILYSSDETDFTHHGLGYLADAISVTVTEERNGAYELSFRYPITGEHYSQITEGAIVKCKLDSSRGNQLFRIYKSSKPINGIVTFSGEHISYDLNGLPLAGFTVIGAAPAAAIHKALTETPLSDHPFSVQSNISTLNTTTIKKPCSVRGLLGGQKGSILDVWGGEYEFDNFVIKLHSNRGSDNGVTLEYGKNITDLKQEANISEIYTHIMPFAVYNVDDGNGNIEEKYVYLTERVIALTNAPTIGHERAYIHDFSGDVPDGTVPTEAWLRAKAINYLSSHDLVTPRVNITVSFVNLADTLEYKDIAPLESVKLCDTVTVRFTKLGINAKAKVIKTVYNVLKEKYDSITIGDAKSDFADTVNKQSTDISHITATVAQNKSRAAIELENAIASATAAITGQSGGYVVLNPATNPQEILILDADSGGEIENAVNVWRFNSAGLGHSSTGYDGTYTTAITYDGKIVADFITAGTLNGNILQAGSVTAEAISQAFKQTLAYGSDLTTIRQEFAAADGTLLSKIESIVQSDGSTGSALSTILGNYSTITQTSTAISTAVSTKVDNSEFGTKITQNANNVRIAWNGNSQYIKLENSQLNIYDSSHKLISFNSLGEEIYYGGNKVGDIGSGYWANPSDPTDDSKRGIEFHLESNSAYMAWSRDESNVYMTKLLYVGQTIQDQYGNSIPADTLYAGCDLDMWNHDFKNWSFSGGCITDTFSGYYIVSVGSGGSISTRPFSLTFKNGILQSASW